MATKEQLELDNKNLNSINSDISDIIIYLESAINELESLSKNVENRYSVDDNSTPIITRINNLKNNLETTKLYLQNTIKSSIETNVQSNKNSISAIEDAEEKAREEEEERKKREAISETSTSTSSTSSNTGYSKPAIVGNSNNSKKKDKWDRW